MHDVRCGRRPLAINAGMRVFRQRQGLADSAMLGAIKMRGEQVLKIAPKRSQILAKTEIESRQRLVYSPPLSGKFQ